MILGYVTLFVAFVLSVVAAYYSILGLTAIFATAFIPIVVMGAALETGKVVTAMWLHRNWQRSPWTYKAYLLPSLVLLMILTSMGIFGFLSKAHLDQTVPTGDVAAQVALYDEKINNERETINNAKMLLQQLDRAVNDLAGGEDRVIKLPDGSTRVQSAAERSLQIRRSQANDRAALVKTIEDAQTNIVRLQQEKAPIASKLRVVEAEVGPIKYIAALIYGDNPDAQLLERAVRWVIILIVGVFDPLAIILILAGTKQIQWSREELGLVSKETPKESDQDEPTVEPEIEVVKPIATPVQTSVDEIKKYQTVIDRKEKEIDKLVEKIKAEDQKVKEETILIDTANRELSTIEPDFDPESLLPLKNKDLGQESQIETLVEQPIETYPVEEVANVEVTTDNVVESPEVLEVVEPKIEETVEDNIVIEEIKEVKKVPHYVDLGNDYFDIEGKMVHKRVIPDLYPEIAAELNKIMLDRELSPKADNDIDDIKPSKATFGTEFPTSPERGEMFLNVASLPSRLYKYNGFNWIIVDKSIADSYTYNEDYLQYLIDKINLGHFNVDDLTASEQDQITEYLKKNDQ